MNFVPFVKVSLQERHSGESFVTNYNIQGKCPVSGRKNTRDTRRELAAYRGRLLSYRYSKTRNPRKEKMRK
jgi:hypothetical protein